MWVTNLTTFHSECWMSSIDDNVYWTSTIMLITKGVLTIWIKRNFSPSIIIIITKCFCNFIKNHIMHTCSTPRTQKIGKTANIVNSWIRASPMSVSMLMWLGAASNSSRYAILTINNNIIKRDENNHEFRMTMLSNGVPTAGLSILLNARA